MINMSNNKLYTLNDVSKGKGEYGIGASAVPFAEDKYTYLRITDINDDGSLNKKGLMSVDDKDAHKYVLCKNDIVFARTGNSTGRSYFYDGTDGTLVYAGFLIKFSLDEEKVNPRILKYYTHSKPYYDWVKSFDTGGTRGNINAKTYGAMPILLPSRNVQDRIVEILKSLDDKIEVNRRINEQLEELAGALFKSWFVDFEPFKDGEFVDSELGMIPRGWKVGTLGELCITNKRTYGAKFANEIAYLDTGSVTKNQIEGFQILNPEVDKIPSRARRAVTEGDILFSSVRPNQKHYAFLFAPQTNMVASTGFIVITANWSGYRYFIYQYLIQEEIIDKLQAIAEQSVSTYPSINASDITNLKLVIPPMDIIGKFAGMNLAFMSEIDKNQQEITQLTTLRDTLLPKLMSGEIDVNLFNV